MELREEGYWYHYYMKSTKDLLKTPDDTALVIPMEDGHFLLVEAVPIFPEGDEELMKVKMLPSYWTEPPVPTVPYWE